MSAKENIIAIIQARMGSTRLPNKMMLHLHGYPVIEWVFKRVSRARMLNGTVVAIPESGCDDVLEIYLRKLGAEVFRGSENDVLDRFFQAALQHKATHVVRVCADNPLTCPEEIDNLVKFCLGNDCDYAFNQGKIGHNLYPDGLGAEMVSFEVLKACHLEARLPGQREHVFNYIWDNKEKFRIKTFDPSDPLIARPQVKVDIDTYEDYKKFLSREMRLDISAREIVSIWEK